MKHIVLIALILLAAEKCWVQYGFDESGKAIEEIICDFNDPMYA